MELKTKKFWDGKIKCKKKPLRMKIRNIAGDEIILRIDEKETEINDKETQKKYKKSKKRT